MSKVKELLTQAKEDFDSLQKLVEEHKGSLDELYNKLNGFGLTRVLMFEVVYGNINAVVSYDCGTGKISVTPNIAIWDKDNSEFIHTHIKSLEEAV